MQGQELTIRGNSEEIDKVVIEISNGENTTSLEADVINNQFTVTTTFPENGIKSVIVYDTEGNVLYEGVPEEAEVSAASFDGKVKFNLVDVTKK